MSEYWKSTPKYWCKFCKTFVRDTTLEKKQHEATPKHQSSIQRSLRELHKTTERDEREKQRAKDEVARLTGLVNGKPVASGSGSKSNSADFISGLSKPSAPPPTVSPEERRKQMEQLAAMGVAVPEQYRKDLSVAGGWSTVSETPIYSYKDEDEDGSKPPAGSFGVRKRKLDEDEEDAETEAREQERKGWGSKFRTYPGNKGNDEDLDALLSGTIIRKKHVKTEEADDASGVKNEEIDDTTGIKTEETDDTSKIKSEETSEPPIKQEESTEHGLSPAVPDANPNQDGAALKQEEQPADPPIVFKKRKGKR